MENTVLSLVIGIISSLFATAIFLGIAELCRNVLLPWYADKIYRGTRIDGHWEISEWCGKEINKGAISMNLDLVQKGDAVTGTYSHKAGDDPIDIYSLNGKVRDRYFIATATPASNRHLDGIAFLFYIQSGKSTQIMTGQTLYCAKNGSVKAADTHEFSWRGS